MDRTAVLDEPAAVQGAERAEIEGLLASAEAFARHAGQITLKYFGRRLQADAKSDGTPVTVADREAESVLRDHILARYPDHGVLGEEFGESGDGARVRWILDPIDGTKSFMRGVPLYGVLIGIEIEGRPAVGVAHFPALDDTVVAGRGVGARWNGLPAQVSGVRDLHDAVVLTTDEARLRSDPACPGFDALSERCAFARSWGDAYGHLLVATGRAEIMIDPELFAWDAAPLLTILNETGGRFTSVQGEASIHGGSGVSSNGLLHDEVLKALGQP